MDLFPRRLSCVIFDMDGTLTQTNELIFASFNHVAARYAGRTFSPREIIGLFGPPEEGALEAICPRDLVPAAMDDLCAFYRREHARLARMHEGIADVLAYLRGRGLRLAVFTGKGRRTASITLEEFGIGGQFDLVVSGNDVTHHKPHPEGIRRVLESLSVAADEVLMVGDAMPDVRASRAAGVAMAAVLWDSYDRERVLEAGTELVFHTVADMHTWFHTHLN
jgi:HAD superfamily hydrolase (TIGR01509 family)